MASNARLTGGTRTPRDRSLNLAVALLEPRFPVNVGHVARLCSNFGVRQLLLVKPGLAIASARRYAAHAGALVGSARIISWTELRKRYDLLIGSTAILARRPGNVVRSTISPARLAELLRGSAGSVCLVLGRETTGLTNRELAACDLVVHVRTPTSYRTLNIGHAAAIILYELSKVGGRRPRTLAQRPHRERFIEYCRALGRAAGFPPYKLRRAERVWRQLLGRAQLSHRELFLLLGWARKALLAARRRQEGASAT